MDQKDEEARKMGGGLFTKTHFFYNGFTVLGVRDCWSLKICVVFISLILLIEGQMDMLD